MDPLAPSRFILSLLILTHILPPDEKFFPYVKQDLRIFLLELQVVDHREERYFFERVVDFQGDVGIVTKRLQDVSNAPRIEMAAILPPAGVAENFLNYNKRYQDYLLDRLEVRRGGEDTIAALIEAKELNRIWCNIHTATNGYYYIHVRRKALLDVFKELGEENVYNSRYPPCVPIWRFHQVR